VRIEDEGVVIGTGDPYSRESQDQCLPQPSQCPQVHPVRRWSGHVVEIQALGQVEKLERFVQPPYPGQEAGMDRG